MSVITLFDPWRDPLCTCPPKYTLSPYISCGHACVYCYITSYIRGGFNPRAKHKFISRLLRDLRKIDPTLPISMANSSDPYTPPESSLCLTRKALSILIPKGCKIQILTKSTLVLRDIDLIKKGNVVVSITITTLNERKAKRIETKAPSPQERLKVVNILSREGIPCIVRVDPLLPGVNCDEGELKELIKAIADAGAKHIVASTYKARPDSLKRIINIFPELRDLYIEKYREKGERRKRFVWYLDRKEREEMLKMVRELVLESGLTFGVCREGMPYLNTAPTCDGTHLIPIRIQPGGKSLSRWIK